MKNTGTIIACDIDTNRLKLVKENSSRLGISMIQTCLPTSLQLESTAFDRILVDAPCSNTGVMRRRVDLRWRISPEQILRLQKTQLELLKQAATNLKPAGILIYSTCSLEPEENSEVVRHFLTEHPNFTLEAERQLLPFTNNVDGAYVARLKRS